MRHVLAMTKRCSFRDLLNVTGLTVVQFFYVQAISRVSKAWLTTGILNKIKVSHAIVMMTC